MRPAIVIAAPLMTSWLPPESPLRLIPVYISPITVKDEPKIPKTGAIRRTRSSKTFHFPFQTYVLFFHED